MTESAAILSIIKIVDFALAAAEQQGIDTAEFVARRKQRIAEGKPGLDDADVQFYMDKLKGDIDTLGN